jgi:hypothetical protein
LSCHRGTIILRKIHRRWLEFPGNVQGSLIILVASLVVVVMISFIKQVGQTIPCRGPVHPANSGAGDHLAGDH